MTRTYIHTWLEIDLNLATDLRTGTNALERGVRGKREGRLLYLWRIHNELIERNPQTAFLQCFSCFGSSGFREIVETRVQRVITDHTIASLPPRGIQIPKKRPIRLRGQFRRNLQFLT